MKKNGYQSHSIPCEGYPVWNITWFIISGITFKLRTGKSFREVQRHEHLNSFDEIMPNCKDVKFRILGFSLATINMFISLVIIIISVFLIKNYENK